MNDIEKSRKEAIYVERKALQLQVLENIDMYRCDIMEMAKYFVPNLPHGIWFDEAGKGRMPGHMVPRVKIIMEDRDTIPVSIEEKPRILLKGVQLTKAENVLKGKEKDNMFEFISRNRKVIMQHWNGDITTVGLFESLKK
jgi:hypothetical protein